MDWFEKLTGFREGPYEETRGKLRIEGRALRSLVNGRSYGIGAFELVALATLRERVNLAPPPSGRLRVSIVSGDVRRMHAAPEYAGALFQVASQFNALEMIGPTVTPEHGVTRYETDRTQGPACAIAAGAATIYRNYFVPVGAAGVGQTATRQLDGLADLGAALSEALGRPVSDLWRMQNGYALCEARGLEAIGEYLTRSDEETLQTLRGKLRIGLQRDVEPTEAPGVLVSQAFCSALPVAYTSTPAKLWRPFATLILEAAYEATICAAAGNASRGASNVVLLTLLGGGAFGNPQDWIFAAMRRALQRASGFGLDVKIVSYSAPSQTLSDFVAGLS